MKNRRKKIWFPGRLDQFQTIHSIRTLIIRPGLSRLLEFEKDIKNRRKKNLGCSGLSMKLAGTDGFGIPERWEFLDGNSDGNFKLHGCSRQGLKSV